MSDDAADPTPVAPASPAPAAPAVAIDMERLTDKVYRLMLADVRRDQALCGGAAPTALRRRAERL